MRRIGILTSGGDCQALNATMRGVAKSLYNMLDDVEIIGFEDGYKGLMYADYQIMKPADFSGILTQGGTILGTSRQPFKQMRLPDENGLDKVEAMKHTYKKLKLSCLVVLGGNGSQKTANMLSEEGLNVVSLPKTIDNDLAATDHTPGYGSAAKYIGSITKEVIRDGLVYDQQNVTILEIMGRNAGWLTGAAALAKCEDCEGPDMIFLPEVTFDVDEFMKKVAELHKKKKSVVVAVSEGVKTADGRYVCELTDGIDFVDAFGHKQLTGTARFLAEKINREVGCKTRAIEFNSLQRCASHIVSRVDITEAYQVGGAAVKEAFEGETGKMIILKRVSDDPYICVTDIYDVHKIANVEKKVPRNWINEAGDYVTEEFVNYIRPLIQAELTPIMTDGLPRHLYYTDVEKK